MNNLAFVALLSISSSFQINSVVANYNGFNLNSFSIGNEYKTPYYNYKNIPRYGNTLFVPAPSNKIRLDSPFDMTAYLVQSCPKKIPLEPRIVSDAMKCLELQLTDEILSQSLLMLAARRFQQFGATACNVWPNVSTCLTEVIQYMEKCQEKQYIGKVTDGIINYLCSRPKGGPEGTNNFGDFLLAGGLSCVDINGFGQCMKETKEERQTDQNFCATIQIMRDCGKSSFRGCFSPKPWQIISAGLDDLEDKFQCGALEGPGANTTAAIEETTISSNSTAQ